MKDVKTITLDNKKYIYVNEEQTKGILYSDCIEIHPITFEWATIIDESSSDDISIFSNIEKYLLPELEELKKKKLEINSLYKELFKIIDKDSNGQIDAQELEEAAKDKAIKKLTSKYIVKHSSEWDKKVNLPKSIKTILEKYKDNVSNYDRIIQHLDNEEKRVEKLAFFEECSSIEGFPNTDKVFHINPIGLVGEFKTENQLITKEMLNTVCSSFNPTDEFMKYINEYSRDFKINTPLRIAHFLSQIAHESACFTKLKENLNYSKKNIRDIWGYKKDKNGKFLKDTNGNRIKKRQTMTYNNVTIDLWDDTSLNNVIGDEKFANWRYGTTNKQGNKINYRGRGYIHITWKENYESYTNYYQAKYQDTTNDFVETPELLEQLPYALEASFHFWKQNNLHILSDTKTVRDITLVVNGGLEGLVHRENNFKKIYNLIK